jgi:hypothetical protein
VWKYNFSIISIKEGIVNYKREFSLSSANSTSAYSIYVDILKYNSLK